MNGKLLEPKKMDPISNFLIKLLDMMILVIVFFTGLSQINNCSMAAATTTNNYDSKTGIYYDWIDSSGIRYITITSSSKVMLENLIQQMKWKEYVQANPGSVKSFISEVKENLTIKYDKDTALYSFYLPNYYFEYMIEKWPNFTQFDFNDVDLGDISVLPDFSDWLKVNRLNFKNCGIDDLTGFDIGCSNSCLSRIKVIDFGGSRVYDKNDALLKSNIRLDNLNVIPATKYTGYSLKNSAEYCWSQVVNGNFNYGVGTVPVFSGKSARRVDCSSFISSILYVYGYTNEFVGKQHTTKDFYSTNWNSKYGWREIKVNGGESFRNKGLQAGDIIVRDNGSGKGHMAYVKEVKSDGTCLLYDCGDASHWNKSNINGYTSASSKAFIEGYSYGSGDLADVGRYPGKIIRIENQYNTDSNNSKSSSNKKESSNGNNKKVTSNNYTLNTVVNLSQSDEYSKSKTFTIDVTLSGGNVNDCEIYVDNNRINNNNGHAEYTIYENANPHYVDIIYYYNERKGYLHSRHMYYVNSIDNDGPSADEYYAFENGKDYIYVNARDNQELKEIRVYDSNKKLIASKSIDNQNYISYQAKFEIPKSGKYFVQVEDHAGNTTDWGSGWNITTTKPQVIGFDVRKTNNTQYSNAKIGDTLRVTIKFNRPIRYYGNEVKNSYAGVMLYNKYPYLLSTAPRKVGKDTITFDIKITSDLIEELKYYDNDLNKNGYGKIKMSIYGITDYAYNRINYANQIPIYIDCKSPTIGTKIEDKQDYKNIIITCKDNKGLKALYINNKEVKQLSGTNQNYTYKVAKNGTYKIKVVDQAGNTSETSRTIAFAGPKMKTYGVKKAQNTNYPRSKIGDAININITFDKKIKSYKVVLNDKVQGAQKDNVNSNKITIPIKLTEDLVKKLKDNDANFKNNGGGDIKSKLQITDYNGNTINYSASKITTMDYENPKITIVTQKIPVDGSAYQEITFQLEDNYGVPNVYVNNAIQSQYKSEPKKTSFTYKAQKTGTYQIKVIDKAGNVTTKNIQVTNKPKVTQFTATNLTNPQSKSAKEGDKIGVTLKLNQKIKSYGRKVTYPREAYNICIRLDRRIIYRSGIATEVKNSDKISFYLTLSGNGWWKEFKNTHPKGGYIYLEVFGITSLTGESIDYSNQIPIYINI